MASYLIQSATSATVGTLVGTTGTGKVNVQFSVSGPGAVAAHFKLYAAVTTVLSPALIEEFELVGTGKLTAFTTLQADGGVQIRCDMPEILGSSAVASVVYEVDA